MFMYRKKSTRIIGGKDYTKYIRSQDYSKKGGM